MALGMIELLPQKQESCAAMFSIRDETTSFDDFAGYFNKQARKAKAALRYKNKKPEMMKQAMPHSQALSSQVLLIIANSCTETTDFNGLWCGCNEHFLDFISCPVCFEIVMSHKDETLPSETLSK